MIAAFGRSRATGIEAWIHHYSITQNSFSSQEILFQNIHSPMPGNHVSVLIVASFLCRWNNWNHTICILFRLAFFYWILCLSWLSFILFSPVSCHTIWKYHHLLLTHVLKNILSSCIFTYCYSKHLPVDFAKDQRSSYAKSMLGFYEKLLKCFLKCTKANKNSYFTVSLEFLVLSVLSLAIVIMCVAYLLLNSVS